jgi:hypothetical protein
MVSNGLDLPVDILDSRPYSQSIQEAEDKVDRLCLLVEQTLKDNFILAQRLRYFATGTTIDVPNSNVRAKGGELGTMENIGDNTVDDHTGTDSAAQIVTLNADPNETEGTSLGISDISQASTYLQEEAEEHQTNHEVHENSSEAVLTNITRNSFSFAFEEVLIKSRAYRRSGSADNDVFSLLSAAGRTGSWSMLSGLSLSELSNIAILALPVYATDISNKDIYEFGIPANNASLPTSPSLISPSPLPNNTLLATKSHRIRLVKWLRKPISASEKSLQARGSKLPSPRDDNKVFGVDLVTSIYVANNAIAVSTLEEEELIYGYIPRIVAVCGCFLKKNLAEGEPMLELCNDCEDRLRYFTEFA